jgi:hypothetical protein
MRGKGEDVEAV